VLTIDGLREMRAEMGSLASPDFAKAMISAGDKGFRDGYEGRELAAFEPHGATSAQLAQLRRQYEAAYQRGDRMRRASPPSPAESVRDGGGVPGVDPGAPPGGAPAPGGGAGKKAGGGAATVYCAVDTGKGGWREVGGRWHYAHHEGNILSSLAARYLGDAGAWKLIYTGSKERGLLPSGSTPDRIPVRDGSGERVLLWMPDQAIARAREQGCIPVDGGGGGGGGGGAGSLPGWAKAGLVVLGIGGVVLLVAND
jgi:hypothetical protein